MSSITSVDNSKSEHSHPDLYPFPSVAQMMEEAMTAFADEPAFEAFGKTLSYKEVDGLSDALGAYFQQSLGIKKGDRVAVMMPNIMAFPITALALIRIGAVQVSINPLYSPTELEHQLNDSGASVIVAFEGSLKTLSKIQGHTKIDTVVTAGAMSALDIGSAADEAKFGSENAISFNAAIKLGQSLTRAAVNIGLNDLIFLQYTGGTTGLSKGAILTHGNLVANTQQFKSGVAGVYKVGDESVVTALPLYHIFALMVNFISYFTFGAKNILIANPRDMDGFVAAIRDAELTAITGVNTLYNGLMAHPEFENINWSKLRLSMGGGAPVFKSTSEAWRAVTGKHIIEGYGLSETSPVLTMNDPHMTVFTETVGKPAIHTDVVLLGDDDAPVTEGERGEICAKGPQVTQGYWNMQDKQDHYFTSDGYFRTGDIGVIDDNGDLKIVDRKKDMILVSGFNVFPNEVEATVAQIPGVIEVACIGIPDGKTGEAVKVFLAISTDTKLGSDDIRSYCRERLAAYKVPKHVEFLPELPKSAVGKILRRKLRD